jgi:4-amino-4-deoxy-L-arabinose transferase-like glycosyltransferase
VALADCWGWRRRAALFSGLIFGSAALPFVCGHVLTTDMLLTLWETLGVLCAWRVWNGRGRAGLWRWGFWVAFGLAFLTKGPPGWLPLLAIVVFSRLRRSRPSAGLWSWGGLALMLAISLTWFAAIMATMPGKLSYFLRDEVVDRLFTNEFNRGKPFWFYFVVVPLGMTPWLHLWPPLAVGAWRRLRPSGRSWSERWRSFGRRAREINDPALFSLLWFSLPLAVFLISASKMFFYVVPFLAPVALWMGRLHVERFPEGLPARPLGRWLMLGAGGFWSALLLAFVALPGGFAQGKSYVALGRAVRELRLPSGERIAVYGGAPDSISFYSGVLFDERATTTGPFLRTLADKARGGAAHLLISDDGIAELKDRKIPWRELARQRQWRLVEILPEGR